MKTNFKGIYALAVLGMIFMGGECGANEKLEPCQGWTSAGVSDSCSPGRESVRGQCEHEGKTYAICACRDECPDFARK